MSVASGPVNSSFVVAGTGYSAGESVQVTFDGALVAMKTAAADGSFSATLAAPADAIPGGHPITAVGQTSGLSLSAVFTVQANWLQSIGNPAGRDNTAENVLDPTTVLGMTTDWTAVTSGAVSSSPAVRLGQVFIGSTDGSLRGFVAADEQV